MTAMPATAASYIAARSGSAPTDAPSTVRILHAIGWRSIFLPSAGDEFAIRFHLHPAIKASRLADGRGVILLLHDRELWTFATLAEAVDLEESVFLAGSDGPRRTVQIVIYGRVGQASGRCAGASVTHHRRRLAHDRTGRMSRNCRCEPMFVDALTEGWHSRIHFRPLHMLARAP